MTNPNTNLYLNQLRKLVNEHIKGHKVKVYLFGSRAKGKERKLSDVDLALLPLEPLPSDFLSNLKDKIDESTIPYFVDVIDLTQVDKEFREKILSEAIEWKD